MLRVRMVSTTCFGGRSDHTVVKVTAPSGVEETLMQMHHRRASCICRQIKRAVHAA